MLSFALECSPRHISKCIFDIDAVKGTRLIKHHVVILFAPSFAFVCGDFSSVLLVDFVAQADEGEGRGVTWASVLEEATLPSVEVLKTLLVCYVVSQSAAVGSSVEGIAERLELFLACSVPNLQRHNRVVDQDFLLAEVSADGGLRLTSDFAVQVLLEQRGLANT